MKTPKPPSSGSSQVQSGRSRRRERASLVLMIMPDPKEVDFYADLVREIAPCKIDVMSRVGSQFDWAVPSQYQLIVVDTQVLHEETSGIAAESLALLERIRRSSPSTSVILLSAEARIEEAVSAIRLGAEDYLRKPINPDAFKLAVKRALDRKFVFGENTAISSYLHLLNSCQMISGALEQAKIFTIVRSYFAQELHSQHLGIYALKDNEPVRVEEGSEDSGIDPAINEILEIAVHATRPFAPMVEAGVMYRFVERGQLTPGLFIFRFRCASDVDYFCVCLSPKVPALQDAFENRLALLHRQLEVTGAHIRQYQGVQHLAYVDDATGLYNTRYLNDVLDREIKRAEESKEAFAILFIDVDFFKKVNDTHGHLAGTRLLNELGVEIRRYVRDTDTVFRYGGDEFVAVLSPCDLHTAKRVAERIRSAIESHEFVTELTLKITVSIGVALFPVHAKSKKGIIEMADRAMYAAKKRSRNFVEILPPDERAQPPTGPKRWGSG